MSTIRRPPPADAELDREALLSAYALGLLDAETAASVRREIRRAPHLRHRARLHGTAAAMLSLSAMPQADVGPMAQVELRMVQRARDIRRPAVRPRPGALAIIRVLPWLAAACVIALVTIFGWLAFQPEEPISGRAIALSEDGATGVLLPRYESRGFALVFWGLPEPAPDETWQLWYVRESGAVEPGPTFERDQDGRAAIALDPNELETGDPLIGFAVSSDNPARRTGETASRDDIRYQFPTR